MADRQALQNRLRDRIADLRKNDPKKLAIGLVVCLAVVACLLYLAAGSCASDEYGVFSHEQAEAAGTAQPAQIAPSTEFDEASSSALADITTTGTVVVFVSGAVENPGLYELQADQRVGDAVALAGGIRADGAFAAVNLAAPLVDGQQIHIPTTEEAAQQGVAPGAAPAATGAAEAAGGTGSGASGSQPGVSADGKVNINTADSTTLQTLNGIGPSTAQKIIDYRTAHGPFASIEDLKSVSGIGEKKYAAIADSICV